MKKTFAIICLLIVMVGAYFPARIFYVQHDLKDRLAHVQASLENWIENGNDPSKALNLLRLVPNELKAGKPRRAKELLVEAQGVLDVPLKDRPLLPPIAGEAASDMFVKPAPVDIKGYDGQAMEPFISPDGKFLFFNNENDPDANTDLHFAERTGTNSFHYLGKLPGVNSGELDAVFSMDTTNHVYFTTGREYAKTRKSIYTGIFDGKAVTGVYAAPGKFSPENLGTINMDVGISPDGKTMYISRAVFDQDNTPGAGPSSSDPLVARLQSGGFMIDPAGEDIMKNVNTDALEYAPAVSEDGLTLFFTRATSTNPAMPNPRFRIMVATRSSEDEPFGEPRVLKALAGMVEAPTVPLDMSEMFFHKKVKGKWQIWRAERKTK